MRLRDANSSEPTSDGSKITVVKFHSQSDLLLVGSADKYIRLFKIDGDKNPKQVSVILKDLPISTARCELR
jgi:WD40 repeat protein